MEGFYGQFTVLMDAKGRISLPSKLRPSDKKSRQDHEFILTKGLDGCLALYPGSEWQQIQQRLGALNFTQKDFRYFSRLLHSVAVNINLDRQGRLLIPSHLQHDAGLTKEVLVIGVYRWIEFWNPDAYRQYLSQYGQSYEEVAEKLFDLNRGQEE
ncbi:MAG: division/cell wall cluster transcriptional repressor MraZ [Candidatus Zixiibacteriota bacterium]|nr:MAG: division/cell wall cluster transcriptional repressor MraZ [candidate division Zixibacteria bacterium]HDL03084.1 division/cell wall cluster transcriptional repressor MraZ [candidate division Zixibacteria bacterium]